MILVGSQRGGAGNLARHLMNDRDNDHVTIEQVRGFASGDLSGALDEAHAISKATRCQQFLFSLSINPPENADVSVEGLIDAADRAEAKLGLSGQPRAVIIHEKEGRRHAHVVWSRIDPKEIKAINLPFFKMRLNDLSKELFLEHGWDLPEGYRTNGWRNPLNFSLAEWQQAKRLDLDPREIKQVFREAWTQSDNLQSFRNAMEESGFALAKGDRRSFVALDLYGNVYSVPRWAGLKTKEVRDRLGDPKVLPSVDEVKADTRKRLSRNLRGYMAEMKEGQRHEALPLQAERKAMVTSHRAERLRLHQAQNKRQQAEQKERSGRLHKGLLGAWELLTGKARAIRKQNDAEAWQGYVRDRSQRERLFTDQMKDRKTLQQRIDAQRKTQRDERLRLMARVAEVLRRTKEIDRGQQRGPEPSRRDRSRDHGPEL